MTATQPRIITFSTQKGGSLKTTTCAQVTYALHLLGKRILAIDMDPQGHLTMALGARDKIGVEDCTPVTEALMNRKIHSALLLDPLLGIVPATIDLAAVEMALYREMDWQFLLRSAIKHFIDHRVLRETHVTGVDFVLIDCPPNLGLLTLNALTAAQEVIIPTTCDGYALDGLAALTDTIAKVQDSLNSSLRITGILPCRFNPQRNEDKRTIESLETDFGDLLFKSRIPESTRLKEAGPRGLSIFDYAPEDKGAHAYASLAQEIIERSTK